jgi:hypothetical protein
MAGNFLRIRPSAAIFSLDDEVDSVCPIITVESFPSRLTPVAMEMGRFQESTAVTCVSAQKRRCVFNSQPRLS